MDELEQAERFEKELYEAQRRVELAATELRKAQEAHEKVRRKSAGNEFMSYRKLREDSGDMFNEVDAGEEQAYRRGFTQGAWQALYAMQDRATTKQIEKWVEKLELTWRAGDGNLIADRLRNRYIVKPKEPPRPPRPARGH